MLRVEGVNRGVVERFIAPVLKTGDPSRGPGVRIPPPLQSKTQSPDSVGAFLLSSPYERSPIRIFNRIMMHPNYQSRIKKSGFSEEGEINKKRVASLCF